MEGNKRRMALFALGAIVPMIIGICFFFSSKTGKAETVPHIIINEIQIAGMSSDEEFVELFNPTGAAIDLGGYKLRKYTKSGVESSLVSPNAFYGTIKPQGYFLIAHPSLKESILADLAYSGSSYYISNDSTILLYDENGQLLDKVGFGAAFDFEEAPATNPANGESVQRTGFLDTNNNSSDFSLNAHPSPQNSAATEIVEEENEDDIPDETQECAAISENIKLNEIFPYPGTGKEFVEVINTGESCMDISGWKVMDEANHKITFPENSIIYPEEYFFLEGNLYLNNDSDMVYLLDSSGSIQDEALDRIPYEKAQKDFSFSLAENVWSWTALPTPGDENIIETPENKSEASESKPDIRNVFLSEILPYPASNEKDEFIEIVNHENETVDLKDWMLRDASKTGNYLFKETISVEPGKYLVLGRSQFKFALNNGAESLYLFNPAGTLVSTARYDKSARGISFNFDRKVWRWSKFLTPGKENKFDSAPVVKLKKVKKAYKNLSAEFSASARDKETKKLKYTWDFGDGRKSYLAKTSHKYLATGSYRVTLTVQDDSQEIEKKFTVRVKKYPRPELELTKIVPNPSGRDTESEIVEVKNNSPKEVDLNGWKIATGAAKIFSHPITAGLNIAPGETKAVTREFSKFSLNNKAGKAQLLFPDGKIADSVEYQKEKIVDDEAYVKLYDEWVWITPNKPNSGNENKEVVATEEEDTTDIEEDPSEEGEVLGVADSTMIPYKTGFSSEDAYIFLSQLNFLKPARKMHYTPMFHPSSGIAYLLSLLI